MEISSFEKWAFSVYEGKDFSDSNIKSYFNIGDSDHRTLFECVLSGIDSNICESLTSLEYDYELAEDLLVRGITESIVAENDEPLNEVFDTIKNSIRNAIDSAGDVLNKGIQIGAEKYASVKQIGNDLKNVIAKVFEKIRLFLSLTWKFVKEKGRPLIKKVKDVIRDNTKGTAVSALSTILNTKSAEKELVELPKDLKQAIEKISGKTYNLNADKAHDELEDATKELQTANGDEIDDIVIAQLAGVTESSVFELMTSIKGLIIEGITINELDDFLNEAHGETHKKGLIGWLIEAIGFALSPFGKLYEYGIKATSNGIMQIISSIARGGIKNAYKYVVMGTVCSLAYHIIHGIGAIDKHFAIHEGEMEGEISVKIDETKRLFDIDDAKKILIASLGSVFVMALKRFFPIVGLILEFVVVSIAAFELIIAFCELSDTNGQTAACQYVMKIEHGMESMIK